MSDSQNAIQGQDVLLRAKRGGEYLPFICSTTIEFYFDTELIGKTTVDSKGFREFAARFGEWGFTLGSITHVYATSNQFTVFDTLMQQVRQEGLDIECIFRDSAGNLKTITGHVLIPHSGISAGAEGFAEDDIEFKGSGAFAINTTIIEPDENDNDMKDPLEYTSAAGGEMEISFPELSYRTIMYVGRDGIGKDSITVGTPNDKQVKYIDSTGTISFPYPLAPGEWVMILYK